MLRQCFSELRVKTRGRGLLEITAEVGKELGVSGLSRGLVTLHIRHTSASLLIQENADPDVREDLETFFSKLVPDGSPLFQHIAEGEDDMPAHVRSALTVSNLSIPFMDGKLTLGTWQGIYLWEHRKLPHARLVLMHVLGEEFRGG